MMEMKLDITKRRSKAMLEAFCVLLVSQNLVLIPVFSAAVLGGFDDLKCTSPPPPADPYGGRPPPSGSNGSPPRHGGGGGSTPYRRSPPPSCGGSGGTPTNPGITPSPTTPGGGGVYTPLPPTPTVGSPPLVLSPPPTPFINPGIGGTPPFLPYTPGIPGIIPGTPGIPGILPGSPIFLPDPNSNPFSGTCDFWRNNPGLIWGLLGWWGTLGSIFGTASLPGINPTMTLPQALSIPSAADGGGFTSLYREASASASYLNSMAYRHFPYTPKQVRDQLSAALHSNRAAGHQARVFKLANEGRLKPKA